ncbi:MogA/MoaB family molybdenum cofactor biosynthesis protein [Haloterrigena sp. SYSU A121-1]|uniref:MogA/MoaB family molybdenum cofactor biosynthesis protein n=1 Tax=Haloterrigena gelatinilytica TaxID=2741724 RepID=A0A8J8GJP5_9EURY|nr:molybdopterin-binding protein [Haloterrigena gelatinilytica]NUB90891.1 MogA/MoaB family molybdenum cofactor biosynthesis protein [Haloterrigena gelatinilytica]
MTETDSSEERQRGATEEPAPDEKRDAGEHPPVEGDDTDEGSLGAGVVTIATDRSLESDGAGEAIVAGLKKVDHRVVTREHIGSDHDRIQSIVSRMLDRDDVDVIVTGGATSIEPSDVTIEAVEPLLEKRLAAFEDLFTSMAYEAVGTRVVAARTIAGVTEGTPVFCLPGNEDAARMGLEEIVLPEIHNLVSLAREDIAQDRWAVDEAALEEGEATGEGGEREGEDPESETAVEPASEPDDGGE